MVLRLQSFLTNLGALITTKIRLLLLAKWWVKLADRENEECVILANGPSLGGMIQRHEKFLDGKDLFCVNHFPTTEFYSRYKPKYYVTSAPDLWLDDIDIFFVNQSNHLFEEINKGTGWPLVFHIPYEASKYQRWQDHLKKKSKYKNSVLQQYSG